MARSTVASSHVHVWTAMSEFPDIKKLILSQFSVSGLGAATTVVLQLYIAYMLPPEGFGLYVLAMTIATLSALILNGGLKTAFIKFVALSDSEDKLQDIWLLFLFQAAVSGAMLLSIYTLGLRLGASLSGELFTHLGRIFLVAFLLLLMSMVWGILRGARQPLISEFFDAICWRALTLGILVMGVSNPDVGEILDITAVSLSLTVMFALLTIWRRGLFPDRLKITGRFLSHYRISLPMMSYAIVNAFNSRADVLIIGALLNTTSVGHYSYAARFAAPITFALSAASAVLAPMIVVKFKNNELDRLNALLKQSWKIIVASSAGLAALSIAAFFLLRGHYSSYSDSTEVFFLLLLSALVVSSHGPVGYVMNMAGFQRKAFTISLTGLALNIVLCVVLVYFYGIIGAALSAILSVLYCNRAMDAYLKTCYGIRTVPF